MSQKGADSSESASVTSKDENLNDLMVRYVEALEKDIAVNEKEQNQLQTEITTTRDLMGHLEFLSTQPEWPDSFIQVNSLAYIPATIVHTGEHYVKLGSEIYSLMSYKETLGVLQRRVDRVQKTIDAFKIQRQQLEERLKFSTEVSSEIAYDTEDMPAEIASDKGTAHKTSVGFYEVIEPYVEKEEREFYKRRQNYKPKISRSEQAVDKFFKRLDELEVQEQLRNELGGVENFTESCDSDCSSPSERIKTILRKCGVYKQLLRDDTIKKYYSESLNTVASDTNLNESVLNELIAKTLINEPLFDSLGIKKNVSENSSNNIAVSAFLDSIEQDMQNWEI